jgi:xanthine dehydrogenase/oxidase
MQVGIEMKFKDMKYPVIIAPTHVPELNAINITDTGVEVGSAVTLTRLMHTLKGLVADLPSYKTSTFRAVINQLRLV